MSDDKTDIIACMLNVGDENATQCPVGGCSWKATTGTNSVSGVIGTRSPITIGKTYQAATDGFVVVYSDCSTTHCNNRVMGFTDSNPNPIAMGLNVISLNGGWSAEGIMPVRKGDYWKTTLASGAADVTKAYWIPLGN